MHKKRSYSEIFCSVFSRIRTVFPVFSPNAGKYRPEKLWTRTLFKQQEAPNFIEWLAFYMDLTEDVFGYVLSLVMCHTNITNFRYFLRGVCHLKTYVSGSVSDTFGQKTWLFRRLYTVHHVEISLLICTASQWTSFCMIGTPVMKEIIEFKQ